VLLVTVTRNGEPEVEAVKTARIGWHQETATFSEDADLECFERRIETLLGARAQQDLLRLELQGALGLAATTRLEQMIESWRARLLRLKLEREVSVIPTPDEIASLTRRPADPLISRVAAKLVTLSTGGDEAASARQALRELHAACHPSNPRDA
jgi:hypothetical protein